MGYLLLHESENDWRNLYESFDITFDIVPYAKVLEKGFKNSLWFWENVHYNNFAVFSEKQIKTLNQMIFSLFFWHESVNILNLAAKIEFFA